MDVIEDIRKNGLFNYLKRGYGISFVKSVKNFFNASKKIVKARNDVNFLRKCKQQEVLPKFSKFKLTSHELNNSIEKKEKKNTKLFSLLIGTRDAT